MDTHVLLIAFDPHVKDEIDPLGSFDNGEFFFVFCMGVDLTKKE